MIPSPSGLKTTKKVLEADLPVIISLCVTVTTTHLPKSDTCAENPAPIVFNWEVNKDINMQTLTDCSIENENIRTATYNKSITEDKTFILSVSDGENEATSSISYKFLDNIFWGSNEIPVEYNSDFINSLANKKLTKSIKGVYSFETNENEYGFWAVPSDIIISSVWTGGFEVTVDFVKEILYTNSQGYTREYNIYKTTKSGLGSFSAEIR
jgi:hypothetical protein